MTCRRVLYFSFSFLLCCYNSSVFGNGKDSLVISFNRGLDFYKWGGKASIEFFQLGSTFSAGEDFYIMLRQPPGFPNQWKLSQKLNASWTRQATSNMNLTGSLNTEVFSDQAVKQPLPAICNNYYPDNSQLPLGYSGLTTGLDNRTIRGNARLGIELPKILQFDFRPALGFFGERISQSTAVGPTASLEMSSDDFNVSGFDTDFDARAVGQFLTGRTNRELTASIRAYKIYSSKSSDVFTAGFRNYQREFPSASGQIDRRTETEYRFGNLIKYHLSGPWSLKLDLNLSKRLVNPSTLGQTHNLKELSTRALTGIEADLGGNRLSLAFSAAGQDQTYPQRRVKGAQYGLQMEHTFFWRNDSLKVNGMLSRFSYDISPEVYSIDTRDEQRHSYQLFHFHDFGEGLELKTQFRVDLYHLVYLKEQRSADNNWERFILFSPEVRYRSENISNCAVFRVSADYIDYDFAGSSPPSRVFRKYSANDSIYIKISGDWGLNLHYLLLLEDQGILDWGAFIQEVSDKYYTHDGRMMAVLRRGELEYAAGVGFYLRRGYHSYGGEELTLGEKIKSIGPELSINGTGFFNTRISLNASYRNIYVMGKTRYSQTLINLTLLTPL